MRAAGVLLALTLAGCGSDHGADAQKPFDIPEGCNPIASDWDCMLPFPSDYFRTPDSALPSGHRVALTETASPRTESGARVDLSQLHPADGFSPGSQILLHVPGGVDAAALTFHDEDIGRTLKPDSATVLIDTQTGLPVPHFAETDPRADSDDDRALAIRPLVRLADARRYVVAIHSLTDSSGAPHVAPEAFRRIRDRKTAGDPLLAPIGERYEQEVFPPLEAAGVARDGLLLAWDFTTRTEANATADMLAVRDHVRGTLKQAPKLDIVEIKSAPAPHIWRQIAATVQVPLYLDEDAPYARLNRDPSGKVVAQGTITVPFTVIIPPSVGNRPVGSPPARLLQYGHGFFGSRSEAEDHAAELADEKGFVIVAADWVGMSEQDRIPVANALTGDTNQLMRFTDRLHQAMANFIAVGSVAQGALANHAALQTPAGPAYDPAALYFHGNSMGHILGGTYVALSPSIERAALGVGGANFSFIMFRAQPFALFLLLMEAEFPSMLDQQRLSAMTQFGFDRIDPLTYAPRLLENTLPGSPAARRVLLHVGMGDPAVPPLSAHLQARTLGLPEVAPAPRAIWGLAPKTGAIDGSALAEFDFHVSPEPGVLAIPPAGDNPVHEGVRRLAAAREQLSRFLKPGGKIEPTCDGVCDPE